MPQPIDRATICSYYVKSLRTGEHSAWVQLAPFIADDAVSSFNEETFTGRDEVLARATGKWPLTAFIRRGGFAKAVEEGGKWVVRADYPPTLDQRKITAITFSFNDQDQITEVIHEVSKHDPGQRLTEIPLAIRGYINDALANETPMIVTHVNDEGKPVVSIRGGIQFYGERQLSGWLRNATGGLASAIAVRPDLTIFYRDQIRKVTFFIEGKGRIEADQGIRDEVYNMLPEVEQQHVPDRSGACLIVDIEKLYGIYGGHSVMIEP